MQIIERCAGEVFQVDFDIYDVSGIYSKTFFGGATDGCDSTINYDLIIFEEIPITVIDTFLCAGLCYEPPFNRRFV